ncbi:MAG: site-specific integrase [Pseudomonadota bacterium]
MGEHMNSKSSSFEVTEIAVDQLNVVEVRWNDLDKTAQYYAPRKVSQISKFEDDIWDFRREGVGRLHFDSIIGKSGRDFFPAKLLLKLIAFVLLGFNARYERSCRTVHNIFSGSKQFVHWLVSQGYLRSVYKNGYFKLPCELYTEELNSFFVEVGASPWHENTKADKVRFLSEWWDLSCQSDYLPGCLRLTSDPFGGKRVSDIFAKGDLAEQTLGSENDEDEVGGWLPIPLEFAFPIARTAVEYIEKYASPLIKFYEVVYEGIVSVKRSNTVTRGRILKECEARGITLDELGKDLPFPLKFEHYASPSDSSRFTYRLDRRVVEKAFSYIKRAAVVIILFTTGMRARELRNLKVGCCTLDHRIGVENFYRLSVTIQKTSMEYYSGQVVSIPVPEITYRAVKLLESLGRGTRRGNILIAPLHSNEKTDHVTEPVCHQSIINYVQSFCEESGINYLPHPHQFRKTIAGWFAMNSPVLGPLLVMTLFSHKNISMTEMYLRNNPLIKSAREDVLVEQSLKLVKSISRAAVSGKLAGVSGDRIKEGVRSEPLFRGLTGDRLGAKIEEYLRERALYGSMHFLLTPLSICMFNPDDSDEKPCTKLIASTAGSRDDFASIGLPLTSACVGAKCDHCLLTECQSEKLEQSLEFYRELLDGAVADDYSKNLHLISTARDFVVEYAPLLEQIR